MTFDEYWTSLVHRVYDDHETLTGSEERFYRLSCVYGETMVDGLEAYFERRYDEFACDLQAIEEAGFASIADDYRSARGKMFGEAPLTFETVNPVIERLLEEADDTRSLRNELETIYRRLVASLPLLAEYRDQFGLREGFYEDV